MARSGYAGSRLVGIGVQLVVATALAVALGLSAGTEQYLLIGVLLGGAAVMLSALNWRRHLIPIIFAYLCVEGFVSLLFRHYRVSLLLKDFLIIIAYMSFLAEVVTNKKFVFFRGILVPMAVLGLLGIAGIFNPGLPNVLVGVVGFKILCFYMPLIFLGYYCFSSFTELRRFVAFLLVLSVPVGLMAVWQYLAGPESFTRFGSGFEMAVVSTPASGYGQYTRAIGTFASPGMLALYSLCMVVMGIIYLGMPGHRRGRWWVLGCLAVILATLLASGTRGGIVSTTVIAAVMLFLLGKRKHLFVGMGLGLVAILVMTLLSQALLGRLESMLNPGIYWQRLRVPLIITAKALTRAPLGWGLGYASVGVRHVMPRGQPIMMAESYIAKLAYEMGWFGLITFAWLVGAAFVQGVRCYRRCVSPESRWVVGCLAIFLAGLLLFGSLGTALDKIPVNVYFWFFLGVMLRVPEMRPTLPDRGASPMAAALPGMPQAPPGPRPPR